VPHWAPARRPTGISVGHGNGNAGRHVKAEAVAAIRLAGYSVAGYTVNQRGKAQDLLAMGVAAALTDRPDLWATLQFDQ
jgi:hypothetical protein